MSAILDKALANRRAKPFQQFGQGNDYTTRNGANGCTHATLQFLAWLWKKRWYTQDQVSRMAGYPGWPTVNRGLYPGEVRRFIAAAGLPYKVVNGLDFYLLERATTKGPVLVAHSYAWVPEWQGYTYYGRTADGKPNGYARPFGRAGKTQLSGWAGAHMGVLLGKNGASRYFWEPNHNTGARPENPPYDVINHDQMIRLYGSYKSTLGRSLYAVIPTRSLST